MATAYLIGSLPGVVGCKARLDGAHICFLYRAAYLLYVVRCFLCTCCISLLASGTASHIYTTHFLFFTPPGRSSAAFCCRFNTHCGSSANLIAASSAFHPHLSYLHASFIVHVHGAVPSLRALTHQVTRAVALPIASCLPRLISHSEIFLLRLPKDDAARYNLA